MRFPTTILAAAMVAGSASMLAAPVMAAPMSGSLALKNSTAAPVQTVQYRGRWHHNNWRYRYHWREGRWIGPGFVAGAIGSALAAPFYYGDAYRSYGYAPRAHAAPVPRVNSNNTGRHPERRFRDPAKGENN